MKTPAQIAEQVYRSHHSQAAEACESEILAMIQTAIEADREQRTLNDAVAEVLDQRGADKAAQLVRDTDPDDDLWNNYFGPMLDELELDYTRFARELEE